MEAPVWIKAPLRIGNCNMDWNLLFQQLCMCTAVANLSRNCNPHFSSFSQQEFELLCVWSCDVSGEWWLIGSRLLLRLEWSTQLKRRERGDGYSGTLETTKACYQEIFFFIYLSFSLLQSNDNNKKNRQFKTFGY